MTTRNRTIRVADMLDHLKLTRRSTSAHDKVASVDYELLSFFKNFQSRNSDFAFTLSTHNLIGLLGVYNPFISSSESIFDHRRPSHFTSSLFVIRYTINILTFRTSKAHLPAWKTLFLSGHRNFLFEGNLKNRDQLIPPDSESFVKRTRMHFVRHFCFLSRGKMVTCVISRVHPEMTEGRDHYPVVVRLLSSVLPVWKQVKSFPNGSRYDHIFKELCLIHLSGFNL